MFLPLMGDIPRDSSPDENISTPPPSLPSMESAPEVKYPGHVYVKY